MHIHLSSIESEFKKNWTLIHLFYFPFPFSLLFVILGVRVTVAVAAMLLPFLRAYLFAFLHDYLLVLDARRTVVG